MTNQEMVDLLQEKAGVSREEAQEALEQSNWDLLDAVLYLEQESGGATVGLYSGLVELTVK